MKVSNIKNLGVDDVVLEVDSSLSPEEQYEENAKLLREIEKEGAAIQEASDTSLDVEDVMGSEERNAKALDILERERILQEERELEWKKEKRSKRIKRNIKLLCLMFVTGVLLLAWLSGYRIPIPDEWVVHIQGIYQSAYDAVTGYFTGK